MVRVPTHRSPTHPGEMLLEEFLIPMRRESWILSSRTLLVPKVDAINNNACIFKHYFLLSPVMHVYACVMMCAL